MLGGSRSVSTGSPFVELARFPNRVGRCTVVIPTRLSLNDPHGQFDDMPALYRMQARAMALWLIATERAIFPDTWFVSRPNEVVSVLQTPDGRAGVVGQVKGGDLKEVAAVRAPQVAQIIDMLERNQMTTASVPLRLRGRAQLQRAHRPGQESSLSATVDFWVQEAQETFGYAFTEENKLAITIAREYFGDEHRLLRGTSARSRATPTTSRTTTSTPTPTWCPGPTPAPTSTAWPSASASAWAWARFPSAPPGLWTPTSTTPTWRRTG